MSGGGYIASSFMALLHAYLAGTPEDQVETTNTGKVKLPRDILFSYLNNLHENPSICLEGWSSRFIIDTVVLIWTLGCLFLWNVLSCK